MQTDLKKLLRNPPLVKIPKISDLIVTHPLLGALPSAVREPLESSTKETMKLHGVALYREGSKPSGIWLISSGVVKVIKILWEEVGFSEINMCSVQRVPFCLEKASHMRTFVLQLERTSISNKHSLHPTFTDGSTLGLYEVLIGKSYICDVITDSVVLCFFVVTEKIKSMLQSDPAVEDFLWQVYQISIIIAASVIAFTAPFFDYQLGGL